MHDLNFAAQQPAVGLPRPSTLGQFGLAMKAAANLLLRPGRSFDLLRERPMWVALFVVLTLATIILGRCMAPYNVSATLTAIPADMPADLRNEVIANAYRMQRVGLMAAPLMLLGKLAFTASIFWLFAVGAGKEERFVRALSLASHVNLIVVLEAWCGFAVLAARGMAAIHSPFDLVPAIGLNALLGTSTTSVPMNAMLEGINPFAVWYVTVLTLGMERMLGLRRIWATTIALSYWAFILILQVGIAAIAALVAHGH